MGDVAALLGAKSLGPKVFGCSKKIELGAKHLLESPLRAVGGRSVQWKWHWHRYAGADFDFTRLISAFLALSAFLTDVRKQVLWVLLSRRGGFLEHLPHNEFLKCGYSESRGTRGRPNQVDYWPTVVLG